MNFSKLHLTSLVENVGLTEPSLSLKSVLHIILVMQILRIAV